MCLAGGLLIIHAMSTYNAPASSQSPLDTLLANSVVQAITVVGSITALALLSVLILLGIFEARYANRVYPGVTFWGADLGGMNASEARVRMTERFVYTQSDVVTLRDGGRSWRYTPAQLGMIFDLDGTVAQALSYGRSGDWDSDLQRQWDGWYAGHDIAPTLVFNRTQAEAVLREIAAEIDKPPVNAQLEINGTEVTVKPGEYGRTVNVAATLDALEAGFANISTIDQALVIQEFRPAVLDAAVQADTARRILAEPLELRIDDRREGDPVPWVLQPEQIGQMLVIEEVPRGNGLSEYVLALDAVQLQGFLESIAPELEVAPANPRFIFDDPTRELQVIQPAVQGRTLNVAESMRVINEQMLAGARSIPLQFDFTAPEVAEDATAASLGITGLVSAQTTYFAGSSESRIQNIQAGASTMHGVLVPPGGTFSFNAFLGDISLDTGFAEAWIIYGGRTIQGIGGGICQVSTTAFRAAWFGGFPIVERHSHAYRVGYYEQGGFDPGLDATIFTPVADFKFINDRDGWLLVETYVNAAGRQIEYRFYGAQDGRTVNVEPAVIQNEVDHPEPLWEENPELAPGEVKQVDFAANGMDVRVSRAVTLNGQPVFEDYVATHFQPWRAVCQYGPGTDLATVENLPAQCTLPGEDGEGEGETEGS